MALQDIITAIVAETDHEIMTLRAAHKERTTAQRKKHEEDLKTLRTTINEQVEIRKSQLLLRTKTHAAVDRRNRVSSAKQSVINAAFAEALAMLAVLPEDKAEKLLRSFLKRISGKGVLRASKRHEALLKKIAPSEQFTVESHPKAIGGFYFIGDRSEADFTFEHLVHGVLRPMKELEIAHLLFASHT